MNKRYVVYLAGIGPVRLSAATVTSDLMRVTFKDSADNIVAQFAAAMCMGWTEEDAQYEYAKNQVRN